MANGNGRIAVRDVAYLLAAVAAGAVGTYGWNQIDPPRPDPFTGTMAREMEARLRRDLEHIENQLVGHINYSAQRILEHDREIVVLKERIKAQGDRR